MVFGKAGGGFWNPLDMSSLYTEVRLEHLAHSKCPVNIVLMS